MWKNTTAEPGNELDLNQQFRGHKRRKRQVVVLKKGCMAGGSEVKEPTVGFHSRNQKILKQGGPSSSRAQDCAHKFIGMITQVSLER